MNPLKIVAAAVGRPVQAVNKALTRPAAHTPLGVARMLRGGTLADAVAGRIVLITGASSGIGRAAAVEIGGAGGTVVLVARGAEQLAEAAKEVEAAGGTAHVHPCDLTDYAAIDALVADVLAECGRVDVLVNNAGRSIRRSLALSYDRFHDFERTMALNYFAPLRLMLGLLPGMRQRRFGQVINISSIGVQTKVARFGAYIASKAALDTVSDAFQAETQDEGVRFTTVHMPLVRTPMIAPTKIYDKFPTISPAQAADLVVKAMVERPHEINTLLGNVGAVAHTVAPKLAFRVLNLAYHVFPDSAAAKGEGSQGTRESEQIMLAKVFKGVHW